MYCTSMVLSRLLVLSLIIPFVSINSQAPYVSPLPASNAGGLKGASDGSRDMTRQKYQSIRISRAFERVVLREALMAVAKEAGLAISFDGSDELLTRELNKRITAKFVDASVADVFRELLKNSDFEARSSSDGKAVMITKTSSIATGIKNQATGSVSGIVVDSAIGKGIDGVTVALAGSRFSVMTAGGGRFAIPAVPNGSYQLRVKLLGYVQKSVSVAVNNKPTNVTIQLIASATSLNEVVTTATGKQRRVDISNDVVKIDAAKLMEAAPVRSVTDLLQAAQVNGVTITPSSGEPGAPKRIRIGGLGSISQNNDPVVIVDGVWIKADFSTQNVARQLGGQDRYGGYMPSALDAIDPNTIETIEVVRGPAAATLYGPDAANGVILITTKRGSVGPARWDLHYSHDRLAPTGSYPFLYKGIGHPLFSTEPMDCGVSDIVAKRCIQDSLIVWSDGDPLLRNEGSGSTNLLSASVSGGAGQVRYNLSAGLTDQGGTRRLNEITQARARILSIPVENRYLKPSQMRNRRLSARLDISPRQGLDFSLSLDGSQQNSTENEFRMEFSNLTVYDSMNIVNVSGGIGLEKKSSRTTSGRVSLVTRWNPNSWSLFSTTLGIDKQVQSEALTAENPRCARGVCSLFSVKDQTAGREASVYTIRAQSSFTPSLGVPERFIRIQPGVTFDLRRQVNYRHSALIERFADSSTSIGDLHAGPQTAVGGVSLNANIRLFDRISFDPAIRHDFSGAKELQNNSKAYPRLGTSWLVSDEPFFPQSSWVSTLRLRGAFGYASVQPTLSQLYGRYGRSTTTITGVSLPTIQLYAIGNPNLQPERSSEIEVGFDADMFDERVMLTLTYGNKQNQNTLVDRQLASSAGVTSGRQENIAKVVNQSTMIQVIARPIERNNFRVRLTTNLTFSSNEIKALGSGVSLYGTFDQRYVEGYPVGGLWSRPVLGIMDSDNDGFISLSEIVFADSLAYMGSNMPRYTMGNNIEVGFLGNFTFNAFVDYKGPFTQNRTFDSRNMRGYWDPNSSLEERMLPTVVSRLSGGAGNTKDLQTVKELRLQSASISMNVPMQIVRRLGAQSIHVSLQGSNLGLWSQYRGRDPGVNSSPVGEKLTDSGKAIGLTRNYSLQFRVRY